MSSEYSTDDDAPPPPLPTQPSATDLPPSISTGSSLLASLVKAKPAPLSDASESSDDDDDDDPRSHAPSEDDDDMDEDELEQLLVKQEQQASLRNAAAADTHAADDDDDNLRKEPKATLSSTVCEVCQEDTSNAKRALVCAQCGVRFHPTCFRQKYAKLIQTNHLKKWFCPDCEPIKKIVVTPKGKGKAAGRRPPSSDPRATPPSRSKPSGSAAAAASSSTPKATDESYARLVEVALKAGRKFNGLVLEKGEELLTLAQSLKHDVEQHLGPSCTSLKAHHSQHHHSRNDATNDTNPDHISISEEASSDHLVLLRKLAAGLSQVESLVYTLQYHAVQTEVDLIKDVKYPPNLEQRTLEREAKEMHKAKLKVKTGGGASRLYSSAQIAKLEDWYAKSSRPESSEIHAMYRIINSPAYADADLQPEGIAVKQIRIWFDNRRAKERLDYMRIKMKDVDTSGLDSESVKKMKAGYIDEAKEVLEGRVAKMRETSSGAMDIMEEAEQLIGDTPASEDLAPPPPLPSHHHPYSIAAITTSTSLSSPEKKPVKAKQRLRMDHVASVRKAVKMAREAGLSEDEIKDERSRAIQLARDRLYMNGKPLGPHPLNKDQVTHLKLTLLKLVEDDAAPECVMDILELLLSVELPVPVLLDTRLDRQLRLVAKAHQHNKDVVRLASKLSEVIQATTDAYYQASSCHHVEFSLDQVETLERAFHENDSPDQDTLVQLASTLNEGDPLDYKHVRSWFYKRKAAGHPLPDGHVSDHGDMGEHDDMDDDDMGDDDLDDDDKGHATSTSSITSAAKPGKSNGRIFNDKQVERMSALFESTARPPNPVMDQLQDQLNAEGDGGITKRQLKTWFSNKRAKDRLEFVKARVKEAQAAGADDLDAVKEAADLEYRQMHKEGKDEAGSEDNDDSDGDDVAAGLKRKKGGAKTHPPAKKRAKRST